MCYVQINTNRQSPSNTPQKSNATVTVEEARNCLEGASYVLPTATMYTNVQRVYRQQKREKNGMNKHTLRNGSDSRTNTHTYTHTEQPFCHAISHAHTTLLSNTPIVRLMTDYTILDLGIGG